MAETVSDITQTWTTRIVSPILTYINTCHSVIFLFFHWFWKVWEERVYFKYLTSHTIRHAVFIQKMNVIGGSRVRMLSDERKSWTQLWVCFLLLKIYIFCRLCDLIFVLELYSSGILWLMQWMTLSSRPRNRTTVTNSTTWSLPTCKQKLPFYIFCLKEHFDW
jgi:hypothetical protein